MIVCLGWGSLIWKPESLPVSSEWNADGPQLPIEFARVSSDGRLTLVITTNTPVVTTFWSTLAVHSMEDGIQALAKREGTPKSAIGFWSAARSSGHSEVVNICEWATSRAATAVIWTALKPGFRERRGKPVTRDEALEHIRNLTGVSRKKAEEYVRRAPAQIRTPYRTAFEKEFGWTAG